MKAVRVVMTVCAFCVLVASAQAQVNVPSPMRIQAPAPIAPATGAVAGGISVAGRATIAVPPDRMRVSLRLFAQFAPVPVSRPTVSVDDAQKAVVDAMRRAGIADARVEFPVIAASGPNVAPEIVGTIAKPTRDRVEGMTRTILANLPPSVAVALGNFQLQSRLEVDDCRAAERRAQIAAIADARERAESAASAVGVRIGRVLAIDERASFPPFGCATRPDDVNAVQGPNFDGYGPLVVAVNAVVSVTYAIVP